MLAFHNEHIASCAFLTYFSPDNTATAANSPTSSHTTLYNDKQSITEVAYPCGALNMRHMRWQQQQQQQQPYAVYMRRALKTRLQTQQQQQLLGPNMHSDLHEICKSQTIC